MKFSALYTGTNPTTLGGEDIYSKNTAIKDDVWERKGRV